MAHAEPRDSEAIGELRILLVEDNEHDCVAFFRALRASPRPHAIRHCVRAEEALTLLAGNPSAFDIIVVDYNLPGDNGLSLCRALLERGIPAPIVVLTGSGNEQVAVEALKLGIADYIIKDPDDGYLELLPTVLPQIVSGYRAKESAQRADDALHEAAKRLEQIVNGLSVAAFVIDREHVVTHWNRACEAMTDMAASEVVGTRQQWRAFYSSERPVMADLIIDNAIETDVDRFYHGKFRPSALIEGAYEAEDFFASFGESGRWLFFTAAPVRDEKGFVVGAIETLQDITEQRLAEIALKESEARFRQMSITDSLTGLYNSRHFFERIEAEISRASRHQEPTCLLMMDVDNFKRFNDTYGHLEGDRALTVLAAAIRSVQRISDSAFRYGGEEFAVLLPNTGIADALIAAERLRERFSKEPIRITSGVTMYSSVSIGVTQFAPGESAASFIRRADEACYEAKRAGKNCVSTNAAG